MKLASGGDITPTSGAMYVKNMGVKTVNEVKTPQEIDKAKKEWQEQKLSKSIARRTKMGGSHCGFRHVAIVDRFVFD